MESIRLRAGLSNTKGKNGDEAKNRGRYCKLSYVFVSYRKTLPKAPRPESASSGFSAKSLEDRA